MLNVHLVSTYKCVYIVWTLVPLNARVLIPIKLHSLSVGPVDSDTRSEAGAIQTDLKRLGLILVNKYFI